MQAVNDRGEQLRVLAVHDISCIGKCSLTVALPVISSVGIETAILPTAVLSTHTGSRFKGFTYRDLTEDLLPIFEHWQREGLNFDAVYVGYLGSKRQIDIIEHIIAEQHKKEALIFIDPVMGDHGRLYANFSADYPQKMLSLCKNADIITPNITEAALMLNEEYISGPYTEEYIEHLLKNLAQNGIKKIVLTGVYFDDERLGVAIYDSENGITEYEMSQKLPGFYDGTGDIFASSFVAAVMHGKTLQRAAQIAETFVVESIRATALRKGEKCYGVNFESAIQGFTEQMQE